MSYQKIAQLAAARIMNGDMRVVGLIQDAEKRLAEKLAASDLVQPFQPFLDMVQIVYQYEPGEYAGWKFGRAPEPVVVATVLDFIRPEGIGELPEEVEMELRIPTDATVEKVLRRILESKQWLRFSFVTSQYLY